VSSPAPEIDVATFLSGALPSPWSTFAFGPTGQIKTGKKASPRSKSGAGVRVWVDVVGGTVLPYSNAQYSGSLYESQVQVLALSLPGDAADGRALARAIKDVLHTKVIPLTAGGNYVSCRCDPARGEANSLGPDEADQYEFTQTFLIRFSYVN
jgi:hypothetical protein